MQQQQKQRGTDQNKYSPLCKKKNDGRNKQKITSKNTKKKLTKLHMDVKKLQNYKGHSPPTY